MHVTRPLASGFAYSLGKSLYIPLTSRCNTVTLPETRGPNFLLPAEVVAALCRVRDAEHDKEQWKQWCLYLETQDGRQKLPPAEDIAAKLETTDDDNTDISLGEEDGRHPSIKALLDDAQEKLNQGELQSVVFAGEGDPTLRPAALIALSQQLSTRNNGSTKSPLKMRLTTNGLVGNGETRKLILKQSTISSVSVALMTHDPDQYDELMKPMLTSSKMRAHEQVCQFIREAIAAGWNVETTAVERPDVHKGQTEYLAVSLGVTEPVRWRPYFP